MCKYICQLYVYNFIPITIYTLNIHIYINICRGINIPYLSEKNSNITGRTTNWSKQMCCGVGKKSQGGRLKCFPAGLLIIFKLSFPPKLRKILLMPRTSCGDEMKSCL